MMIITDFLVEFIGFAAGGIILASSLPPIIGRLRRREPGSRHEALSRAMIAAGNLGWVVVGLFVGNVPITLTCGINMILNALLCVQIMIALQKRPQQSEPHYDRRDPDPVIALPSLKENPSQEPCGCGRGHLGRVETSKLVIG